MKIFEISPEMRCLGGKRWEKLWIGYNWPFPVNLSLIFGEKMGKKIENPVKWPNLAILTKSKPLFRPNLQLWVILSHIGVKRFENVGKLNKVADVAPQEWKSWIQVKVTFWFWLMYPPPPRNWNWTKHECYRKKNHFKRGHQVHFTNLPTLPLSLSDSMPEQETGEFQFQMDL